MATYDRMQVKGSHNSYSRALTLGEQLDGDPETPSGVPCRALELDMVQSPTELEWQVSHGGAYAPTEPGVRLLSDWLHELRDWSDGHPGHPVVTVHLDMKNAPVGTGIGEYAEGLDAYVSGALGRDKLYGPADFVGGLDDVVTAGRAGGWPDEMFLQDKFVLCLSGRPKRKERYSEWRPRERLCFVDRSWARWDQPPPASGHWVFLNVMVDNRGPGWEELTPFLRQRGFVVRAFNLENPHRWAEARAAGVQILSTNQLRDPLFVF